MNIAQHLVEDAIALLKKLIAQPSFSREEDETAYIIEEYFRERNIPFSRLMNNVWARNEHFEKRKPTILLNSHHDTVRPNASYTRDPFEPTVEGDVLYGLGSNDAGAPLVALLAAFTHFYHDSSLPFNLVLAATAEEEISGKNGVETLLPSLPKIDFGIVGEPTSLDLAIAEKGLLVLDCHTYGKPGHAARDEGENAISKALKDILWFNEYEFARVSETLGKMKMSLTMIEAGTQHNVVPDRCKMTVDVRVTDAYTLKETLRIIQENVDCEVVPRSVRLNSSGVSKESPIMQVAQEMGLKRYGSPTLSDQALMPFETVKFGPGDSARSHSADEFIFLSQISQGVEKYIEILARLKMHIKS